MRLPGSDTRPGLRAPRRRRALTLVETIVALGAFSGVTVFLVHVSLLSARQTDRSLFSIPAQSNSYRGMDRVRAEVQAAQFGSLRAENDGRDLYFYNPALERESHLSFNPANHRLSFRPDTSTDFVAEYGRYEDCTFEITRFGRNVEIVIQMQSKNSKGARVPLTQREVITIRN